MAQRELSSLRLVPTRIQPKKPTDRAVVEIYRPFFLAGVVSVLTAGCALGAVALLGIALQGSYTASAWTPYVLAHANSQVYGWVAFFIIGFSLQQHAPTVERVRSFHRLAWGSLILMAVGIGLRFAAEPLVHVDRSIWMPVGIGSCVLQALAVVVFLWNITVNRHRTGQGLTWQSAFVFASLAYLLLIAFAEPFVFALTHQIDPAQNVAFVAKWFSPYRDAQFLGFVTMMIFGVALSKMHSCFGAREASRAQGLAGLVLWNAGLFGKMVGWLYFIERNLAASASWIFHVSGVLLAVGAVLLVLATGMFERLAKPLRSHKFIRAAFVWLLVAGVMLILEPLHLKATGQPFSHAYTGAVRHVLTVGFISQMIIGVGTYVVAQMNGLIESRLSPLWSVFWLLNVGNVFRVGLEVMTDYTETAFLPMGVTGFVELTALAIWGAHVGTHMVRTARIKAASPA
ncbi:MAG: NnrS family protein [Armatimonadetes bacterium]|nr:NnrS family protein [Armatimonadota bacterium]